MGPDILPSAAVMTSATAIGAAVLALAGRQQRRARGRAQRRLAGAVRLRRVLGRGVPDVPGWHAPHRCRAGGAPEHGRAGLHHHPGQHPAGRDAHRHPAGRRCARHRRGAPGRDGDHAAGRRRGRGRRAAPGAGDRRMPGTVAARITRRQHRAQSRGSCDSSRSGRTAREQLAVERPDGRLLPTAALGAGVATTMEALIAGGDAALAALRAAVAAARPRLPTIDPASVEILAPLPRPGKLVAVGLNYHDHATEGGVEPPVEPMLFTKFTTSIVGPGATIEWDPALTESVDLEAELGVVIGRTGAAGVRGGRPVVRVRLHLRQRRQRPRPPEGRQAVRARQVARHLRADGPGHHDRGRDPRSAAAVHQGHPQRGRRPGLEHVRDDLQRGPHRGVLLARLHPRAG